MKIPHSQVTISGPFRENSRAHIEVVALGDDQVVIRSVSPKFTHEHYYAGEHLDALRESLEAARLHATEPGSVVEVAS
jgi:hypothetical protein